MADCVVCGAAIRDGEQRFANDWERVRKRFPCCSAACCESFDPDKHWMPAVWPAPAGQAEERKLLLVAVGRLRSGDSPTVVVHDLLLAGVEPGGIRKILHEAGVQVRRSRRDARQLGVLGAIGGLLSGHWRFYESRDKRDPDALQVALADLDRWEARRRDSE